jgi:hypothetical protein
VGVRRRHLLHPQGRGAAEGGLLASAIGEAAWEARTMSSLPTRRVLVNGRFLHFMLPSLFSERIFDRLLGKMQGLRCPAGLPPC